MKRLRANTAKEAARAFSLSVLQKGYKPIALHTYTDKDGQPIYYRARLKHPETGDKWIRPFYLNGDGYVLGEPEYEGLKPLYNLKNLQSDTTSPVWIVEGENKVDLLKKYGLLATTSGGSSSAKKSDWSMLYGREVIIWPDNDEAGSKYCDEVAAILTKNQTLIKKVKIETLGLNKGEDCVDWIEANQPVKAEDFKSIELEELSSVIHLFDEWEKPIPLKVEPPEWPEGLLPSELEELPCSLARELEVPLALPMGIFLSMLATANQGAYTVKLRNGFIVPLNLWICVAMPPGARKSPVNTRLRKPLIEWENEQAKIIQNQIEDCTIRNSFIDRQIDNIKKGFKGKTAPDIDDVSNKVKELEQSKEIIPVSPRLFTSDSTPEALALLLQRQNERISVLSDEGGIFDVAAGMYSNGRANIDIYLQGFDGSSIATDRKSGGAIRLKNPLITMGLAVQPQVLENLGANTTFTGRGFIHRFLYLMPQFEAGHRTNETPSVSEEIELAYHRLIERLLLGTQITQEMKQLELSEDARKIFRDFEQITEKEKRQGNKLESIVEWAEKLTGTVGRLAGNIHLANCAIEDITPGIITPQEMTSAVFIGEIMKSHALYTFGLMKLLPEEKKASIILDYIKKQKLKEVTQRELMRAKSHIFKKAESLEAPLSILQERNYIRKKDGQNKAPGRPSEIFEVNPELY